MYIKLRLWLFQFCFFMMLDFALGGITFFLMAVSGVLPPAYTAPRPENEYRWVLLTNFYETIISIIAINLFVSYIQPLIKSGWQRYMYLLLLLYLSDALIVTLLRDGTEGYSILGEIFDFHPMSLIYASHVLIAGSLLYYWMTREFIITRKIHEQEYQLLLLQELKTKAELEALQAKINPHFLYNALNSIASLVHINPDKAEQMVLLLSKFFRYSTQVKNQLYNTLAEELEMVKTYLEVEQVRFEDRMEYSIDLQNEDLNRYRIPSFLLQPLIENAVKHGISKIPHKGIIHIKAYIEGDLLCISIHDNGAPFPQNIHSGYGLQSTQDKLRLLGGKNTTTEISNLPEKRVLIKIEAQSNSTKTGQWSE
jgi:two-component system, LytTR family, sensor kinase